MEIQLERGSLGYTRDGSGAISFSGHVRKSTRDASCSMQLLTLMEPIQKRAQENKMSRIHPNGICYIPFASEPSSRHSSSLFSILSPGPSSAGASSSSSDKKASSLSSMPVDSMVVAPALGLLL